MTQRQFIVGATPFPVQVHDDSERETQLFTISLSGTHSASISAVAAQTLASVTQAATLTVTVAASATQTLDTVTQAATGAVVVAAAATQTLATITQTAEVETDSSISVTAAQTLATVTQTATLTVAVHAAAAQTLATLSQSATLENDAPVLASGPFFFAWVPEGTAFDAEAHAIEDENVFAFELSHTEGEFPTLVLDVVNPRIGLLNAGREQWAWFSHGEGSAVEPLFYGRIVGIPQELQNEVVRFEFRAKPADYDAQKEALAETLRVAPYWDPLWLSEEARLDPDTVLESRSQLWHIDRVTHDVTVSDIIQGEDGTLNVAGGFFYDSLSVTYSSPPGRACTIKAQAVWQQQVIGTVDITSEFPDYIETFSHDGLTKAWPDTDTRIGRGWRFVTSDWRPYWQTTLTPDVVGGSIGIGGGPSGPLLGGAQQYDLPSGEIALWTPGRIVPVDMVVEYDVNREYVETLELTVNADVQALLSDAGADEVITLDVSAEVDQAIDPPTESGAVDFLMPIRDRSARRYFQSERGLQSVDYLVCLARAQLLHRARAIDISIEVPFADGVDLSCRKMVTIADDRLPGGEATGKVKGYALSLSGDTGDAVCRITIGCAIGNGGTAAAAAGTPVYVDAGYVDAGYQVMAGATREIVSTEITVEDFAGLAINDEGVDWTAVTAAGVVDEVEIINGATDQKALLDAEIADGLIFDNASIIAIYTEAYTQVRLNMISVQGGPYETTFPVGASTLKIAKQIDLEAAA
jgi:hypothetical protein